MYTTAMSDTFSELSQLVSSAQRTSAQFHRWLDYQVLQVLRDAEDNCDSDTLLERTVENDNSLLAVDQACAECLLWLRANTEMKDGLDPSQPAKLCAALRSLHDRVLHASTAACCVSDISELAGGTEYNQCFLARDSFYASCDDAGVSALPYDRWDSLPSNVLNALRSKWLHYCACIVAMNTAHAGLDMFACATGEDTVFVNSEHSVVMERCKQCTLGQVGDIGAFYVQRIYAVKCESLEFSEVRPHASTAE